LPAGASREIQRVTQPTWTPAQRTVLFADLRGSTALYQQLGNAAAAALVTAAVQGLANSARSQAGRVVKTLGDGLIVLFDDAPAAVQAALGMQEALAKAVEALSVTRVSTRAEAIRLHVALEHGEVIELGEDCYGDAVNVAARLLDHSGDEEVLITAQVLQGLDEPLRRRFRSLDVMALRGRSQPVAVFACAHRALKDGASTWYEEGDEPAEPDGIRLWSPQRDMVLGLQGLPLVLGRGPQARFPVEDAKASRTHARLEWRGSCIHLTDLSYNGTHVRFSDGELVTLRRSSCILHGRGQIGLGRLPELARDSTVEFELLRFAPTEQGL
jgi:class 3 adenylate cyclase